VLDRRGQSVSCLEPPKLERISLFSSLLPVELEEVKTLVLFWLQVRREEEEK
jgi:hypothetical protein